MKNIKLTKHILEQTSMRKKITGVKAGVFLRNKYKNMIQDNTKKLYDSGKGTKKVIVGNEKIVFIKEGKITTLITYIKKTEYDIIEHKMLRLISYHTKKNNK